MYFTTATILATVVFASPPRTLNAQDGFSVPIIDLQMDKNFTSNKPTQQLVHEIGTACMETGFLQIVNHGISAEDLQKVLGQSRRFFAQPNQAKEASRPLDREASTRGYFGHGDENLDFFVDDEGARAVDNKEGFDMGNQVGRIAGAFGTPNRFPAEEQLPGFKAVMNRHHQTLSTLARQLLRYMALALGQPHDFFDKLTTNPVSTLRLLHYWPKSHSGNHSTTHIGAGAHTDYGLLTLLQQDSVGGLQVFNKHTSEWLKVPYVEGALVVNLGDMMERWSSKKFMSTIHRVIDHPERHRYSAPFFFNPNIDTPIQPMGMRAASPSSFPTCGDVLAEFYTKAGLLK